MAKKKNESIRISFVDEPASEDVTGSFVLVETPNYKIGLDCGLAQSNNKYVDFLVNNRKTKSVKPKNLDFIFISHLHSDHALLTPKFYKEGFRGATIISSGSKGVLKTMAMDSAFISERDVLVINNQHGKHYSPLYDIEDVNKMLEYTIEKPMNEKIFINEEISFEFIPSGHLLGGCQILLYITTEHGVKTILYTGDLGNKVVHNYFVGEFQSVNKYVDVAICESTYGDRPDLKTGIKERKNDLEKLKTIIDTQVHDMNGRVIIPTFAQSRCQQLALMIYELYKNEEWQPKVYVDSPLSISIFEDYEKILEGEDKEKFDKLMNWDNLVFVKESEDSKSLIQSKAVGVYLSSAGMCNVGRIRYHLKSAVPDVNATVLFVGYSTEGSLASLLKDNKRKSVTIDEKEYKCRCATYSLKSMSGHMPFEQMVETYTDLNCGKIILHHGSVEAKETLAKKLRDVLADKCKSTRVIIANSSLKCGI